MVLESEHPARRPCPVDVRGGLQAFWMSHPQRHPSPALHPASPSLKGASFSLHQCSGHYSQLCSPFIHTVRMHKGEQGASYQRGEKLTGFSGSPQQAPERSRRSQTPCRDRSACPQAPGPKPAGPPRSLSSANGRRCQTRSQPSGPDPSTRLSGPHSSRLFSRLRKRQRPPSLHPHLPHTGIWVAGT